MKTLPIIIALPIAMIASHAAAQGPCSPSATGTAATTPPTTWERLTKRLEIRQNTNVKKDIAQPAFITFTNPDEGPTTYQIGLGVLASVCPGTGFDVDALIDYQRNTAVKQPQDALKMGATGYWRLGQATDGYFSLINFRSNFKRDGVKSTKGWQNAVGYSPVFTGVRPFPFPNNPFRFGQPSGNRLAALELVYVPLAGLEFDHVLRAPTDEEEGTATRSVLQVNLALYPAPLKARSPVEFLFGFVHRGDLKDTTNQTDDSHPLFTFEGNYFPFQKENVGEIGFGVAYKSGEDPDQGFERQAYWQFTLKFRLKKQ